ncbi:hypothetical protein [Algibacillus agarilyticus]|uniref:hypothetical protein n=1 Tax=Algibacillus agarilyticus TaxID=2234133 RepID=UPI000DCFB6C2|nr:hypothetical protein [Algibacillus agarilyticus]
MKLRLLIILSLATAIISCAATSDSNFISGKFTPPDGKILLFIGQDSDTITDYIKSVPEDNIEGITLYSSLKHAEPNKTLKAMFKKDNWGSGDVDFALSLQESNQAALAIGLAFDSCNQPQHGQAITKGEYDKSIDKMLVYLSSLSPRKVFLRIGYEFDGPWNCYKPTSYISAFRHIALKIKAKKIENITTVWQSATWPEASIAGENTHLYDHADPEHLNKWYPGDDVVDWISVSVFYRDKSQWLYPPAIDPALAQEKLLTFARLHNKPVMIAESAPQGYRTGVATKSPIHMNQQEQVDAEYIWQNWFQAYFDFIYANNDVIRAVAYINTHWEAQPMWQCEPKIPAGSQGCAQGNWGDSRVQSDPEIKKRWLAEITNEKYWIQTSQY